MLSLRLLIVFAFLPLVAACPGREVSRVDPGQNKQGYLPIRVDNNREVDILFVIDNSLSMDEEQDSLSANFVEFTNVLNAIDGGLPDVHIGVVSTDIGTGASGVCSPSGDNGTLQTAPRVAGCSPPTDAYISDVLNPNTGMRERNYTDSLAETFSCIAELGTAGCGFEQPLESMRRALNGSNINNAGFLRDNAYLAVILITDEDDCSTENNGMFDRADTAELGPLDSFRCFEFGVECEPDDDPRQPGPRQNCVPRESSDYMYEVQEYIDFLADVKGDPNLVFVAGIIGNASPVVVGVDPMDNEPTLEPSCSSAAGIAAPGVRLQAFLDGFPTQSTSTTICNENLSDALIQIADSLAVFVGNPCLVGDYDTDPDVDGVQYDCIVSDVRFRGTDREEEDVMRQCDAWPPAANESLPCWDIVPDADLCCDDPANCGLQEGSGVGLSVVTERGGATVPRGTDLVVRCVVM